MSFPYAAEAEQEIGIEELEYLEAKYKAEKQEGKVTADTQFLYAWGLIRSKFQDDKLIGIKLLEEIIIMWPARRRECLYYLAVGHYRLGNYKNSLKNVDELLQMEPGNQQAISLRQLINAKANREGILGLALVGGVVAAVTGIAIALMRRGSRE